MVSRVIPVEPFDLVVFGATGDLASRKIIPGLYRRFWAGQMPPDSRVIGAARSEMDDITFRTQVAGFIDEFVTKDKRDPAIIAQFLERLHYVTIDAKGDAGWNNLKELDPPRRGACVLFLGGTIAVWRSGRAPASV